jgi:hypothetical protein
MRYVIIIIINKFQVTDSEKWKKIEAFNYLQLMISLVVYDSVFKF